MRKGFRDRRVGFMCGEGGCQPIMESEMRTLSTVMRYHGVPRSVATVWLGLGEQLRRHDQRAQRRGYLCCECDLCNKAEREMERIIPGSVGKDAGVPRPQEDWRLP